MSDNKRFKKTDIVFLNILFCMLVIFIHISSEVIVNVPKNTYFFKTVFSLQRLSHFVVQGFLLLSGVKLFLNKRDNINYFKYYLSRFTRIIIPYIIWVIIYYIYFCSKNYYVFSLKGLFYQLISGDLSAHFYFIIILLQFDLLTPLWMFLFKRGNAVVHIAFSLMVTVIASQYLSPMIAVFLPDFNFDFSNCFLKYQVYYTAGCFIGLHYEQFKNYLKRSVLPLTLGFLACAFLNVSLSLKTVGNSPHFLELVHIMYSMSAILFFYMIAQFLSWSVSPFKLLDRASYGIYLMHCLVIVIINDIMTQNGIFSFVTRFEIRAIFTYAISIGLCVLWQIIKIPIGNMIKKS